MMQTPQFAINFNAGNDREKIVICLPNDQASRFPAFFSLLYFQSTRTDKSDLSVYQFASSFDMSFLWQPLLLENRLPFYLNFPPEVSNGYSKTLELQAARMLLQACIKLDLHCQIQFFATNNNPVLYKIIDTAKHQHEPLNASLWYFPQKYCTTEKLVESISEPSFECYEALCTLDTADRDLLAFWQLDHDYFLRRELTPLTPIYNLWKYQQQGDLSFINTCSDLIEKHYINASVSLHDEVIVDQLSTQKEVNSESNFYAKLIKAYAHIKCNVVFPTITLDELIDQCIDPKLTYWRAYLLAYGHIVRSYGSDFSYQAEKSRFTESQILFKSLGDLVGITRVFHARASLLAKNEKYRAAIKLLTICKKIRTLLQEPVGIARVLNGTAYVYLLSDNLEDSKKCHLEAIQHLQLETAFDELAFTQLLMSWLSFLQSDYPVAIHYGESALEIMAMHQIHTLAFRTKPDIHAQLGLCYFFNGEHTKALQHSDYCEEHKVGSSATGELLRTLLRGLINDARGDQHLADISFQSIPELLRENTEIDIHIEALYYRILFERAASKNEPWFKQEAKLHGIAFCKAHGLSSTLHWFDPK